MKRGSELCAKREHSRHSLGLKSLYYNTDVYEAVSVIIKSFYRMVGAPRVLWWDFWGPVTSVVSPPPTPKRF